MLTLLEAKTQLAPYLKVGEPAAQKINLAQERILAFGKWKGLVNPLELTIYEDNFVVLPPEYETALAFSSSGNSLQPRDKWFTFYHGEFYRDNSMYPTDMGDTFCTFKSVIGAASFKFELGYRGVNNIEFVFIISGSSPINGTKFYLTETLYNTRQVYSNAAGDLLVWSNVDNTATYISSVLGDTTGAYWVAVAPMNNISLTQFNPMGGAVGAVYLNIMVPPEASPLNPLLSTDGVKKVVMNVRRSNDQGVLSVEEYYNGIFNDFTSKFAEGEIREVTKLTKERTTGVVSLYAQFYESLNDWDLVGSYSEIDTDIRLRKYALPGVKAGGTVLALCKKRYRKVEADTDPILVESLYSLRLALEALSNEDAGDLDKAMKFWAACKKSLDDALNESKNSSGTTVPIYVRASAGAGLRAIR